MTVPLPGSWGADPSDSTPLSVSLFPPFVNPQNEIFLAFSVGFGKITPLPLKFQREPSTIQVSSFGPLRPAAKGGIQFWFLPSVPWAYMGSPATRYPQSVTCPAACPPSPLLACLTRRSTRPGTGSGPPLKIVGSPFRSAALPSIWPQPT